MMQIDGPSVENIKKCSNAELKSWNLGLERDRAILFFKDFAEKIVCIFIRTL